MRFENSELRAFRAVQEESGFKRAAEALHISQSAVSQAVASLETKLETSLIKRGKDLKLTEAGKRLFDHAVEVLRDEQHTIEDIRQLRQGRRETLNIAMDASINHFFGVELISAYYTDNPETRMKVSEMPSRNIIYAVLAGSVELGLGPFQKHMPAFDTIPLYDDSHHLVVSPRHPQFAAMIAGDEKALLRAPLIASVLDDPDMRPALARIRDQFSTVWEVSSLTLRLSMVEQGMGVTFIERKLLDHHPKCRHFKIMDDVSFGRINRQVGLYFRSGKPLSDSGQNFVNLCRRYWKL